MDWFDLRIFLIGFVGSALVELFWLTVCRGPWRARHRRLDLMILWPACKQNEPDLDHAKAAFAMHAFRDLAWLELGDELFPFIDRLT